MREISKYRTAFYTSALERPLLSDYELLLITDNPGAYEAIQALPFLVFLELVYSKKVAILNDILDKVQYHNYYKN